MTRCPNCRLRMVCQESAGRAVCLSCAFVLLDDPKLDMLASVAFEESARPIAAGGRHSKRIPLEKHTDGLTHVMGTHDKPWRSEVS